MRRFFLIIITAFITGCSGNGDKEQEIAPPPTKAVLIAPAQNELCTQGTVVSAAESTVTLQWNAASNAQGYELNIKDLEAGTTTSRLTTATQLSITLKRNTPYSWYVKSGSSLTTATAQSDVWKFYNAGPAAVNYAPFPADLIAPDLGQSITAVGGKIAISWAGNDVDNDIESYDVYLSDATTPALLTSGVTKNTLNDIAVVSGKQYYWKVVTKDKKGNKSESSINYFRVN
ncbi:hypothetical protein [Mucilaginibacter sp. HD30]